MELLFQYIPLMTITMLLYCASFTICFLNGCLLWIQGDREDHHVSCAKILALTTRLENIEKSTNANSAHATTGRGGGGNNLQGAGSKNNNPTVNMTGQIATWRTINKGPTSTAPDGTTVYWCPKHVHPPRIIQRFLKLA